MKRITDRIKYWAQLFLVPVYWLSCLFPRSRKIWVIGSTFGRRYADNGRYFYLYLSQCEKENIRPIWISRRKEIVTFLQLHGYESYYVRSLKGIWYCLRAKVYVYDNYTKDICYWTSGGALHINLWHGSGNKKTNYDNKFDYLRHPRSRYERWMNYLISMTNEKPSDYTVATSPMMKKIFISAFHTDGQHILIGGYPRNDVLFNDCIQNVLTAAEEKNLQDIQAEQKKKNRILVYMPTFRSSESMFFDVMRLEEFNEFLRQNQLMFYTKLHPKSKVKGAFETVSYTNIRNIDADVDPYTFLKQVDLLVTDYSSIYSDFLMLNRPSVLFPYDFEEYSKDTRECYFEYDEYMPEVKAYTMEELMADIRMVLQEDTGEAGRMELRGRIFEKADGAASKRLYREICRLLN